MDQLTLLWNYQQADMAADRFENDMKNSLVRRKYQHCREILLEQQENAKRIENEIATRADRMAVLKEAVKTAENQLRDLHAKVEAEPADDLNASSAYVAKCRTIVNTIVSFEEEIAQIAKDMAVSEKRQKDVVVNYNKYRAEYNTLKEEVDKETKEKSVQLNAMREAARQRTDGISPELLEKYNSIKSHIVPPLAKLASNQCTGCNMSLPSAVARNLKAGQMVECETCGRLLML